MFSRGLPVGMIRWIPIPASGAIHAISPYPGRRRPAVWRKGGARYFAWPWVRSLGRPNDTTPCLPAGYNVRIKLVALHGPHVKIDGTGLSLFVLWVPDA